MKKLTFTFAACFLFLFSCSDDDTDVANVSSDALIGTWSVIEIPNTFQSDLNGDNSISANLLEELPCYSLEITFGRDASFRSSSTIIQTQDSNENISDSSCNGTFDEEGTYSIDGNTVRITVDDETTVNRVLIQNDRLTLTQESEQLILIFEKQ